VSDEEKVRDDAIRTGALLLNAAAAAKLLGVSRSFFLGIDSSGRLGPQAVRINGAVRWKFADLTEWVEQDCPSRERFRELRVV